MPINSNPSHAEVLLPVARDAFAFLGELVESGNVSAFGLESSQARINALLQHVVQESLNILRHEDETLSVENLGGVAAVRRLVLLTQAARGLPEEVRLDLEQTLAHRIHGSSQGRATRTIRNRR